MHARNAIWIVLVTLILAVNSSRAADSDGDGVDDSIDNCREHSNPLQLDADEDGVGNRCDVDFDRSGLADGRVVETPVVSEGIYGCAGRIVLSNTPYTLSR